jgi:signal peptidase II
MPRSSTNAVRFWAVVVTVLVVDVITKAIAETTLLRHAPRQVFGDWLQLRLVYNPGAAFGLHLGDYSRWIFILLTLGALYVLFQLYRGTRAGDGRRVFALALVCAGAIGNLVDRLRPPRPGALPHGVVDFIDVGIGDLRWPTFNVADMAVSVGAFLLAWVLWGEESAAARPSTASPASVAPEREGT